MVKTEEYATRPDEIKLFRSFSDSGMLIRKDGTEQLYSEAVDVEGCGYTYTETDIPAYDKENDELTVEDTLKMLNKLGVKTDDN